MTDGYSQKHRLGNISVEWIYNVNHEGKLMQGHERDRYGGG